MELESEGSPLLPHCDFNGPSFLPHLLLCMLNYKLIEGNDCLIYL